MKVTTIIKSKAYETLAKEKHFSKCFLFWYKLPKLKLLILDVDYAMKDCDGNSF
jgi:hypothetical protein